MQLVISPEIPKTISKCKIFLAGSIEMGKAIDWQLKVITSLSYLPVQVFNPRRKSWDNTWEQSITNPNFKEQVEWEQMWLNEAEIIFFYFQKDTLSPISLLEFGQTVTAKKKIILVCENGFWRRGNLEVVCGLNNICIFENFEEGIEELTKQLKKEK